MACTALLSTSRGSAIRRTGRALHRHAACLDRLARLRRDLRSDGSMLDPFGLAGSVRPCTCQFDHLAPFLGLVDAKLGVISRRTWQRRCPQIGKACLQLGIGKAGVDLPVELLDNLSRRVPGRSEANPYARLE